MTKDEVISCQYREHDVRMTLVTNFGLVFFQLGQDKKHFTFDLQFRYRHPFSKEQYERPDTIWKCYQVASLLPTRLYRKLSHARRCYES